MSASIRILLLNDFSPHLEAIVSRLEEAGLFPETYSAEDLADFEAKTADNPPHLILLSGKQDPSSRLFDFVQVRYWLVEQDLAIPVWMIVEPDGEAMAAAAVYKGLDDYFFTDRLGRLAPLAARLMGLDARILEPVDLNQILETCLHDSERELEGEGTAVTFLPGADLPKVSGETYALTRALFSLLNQIAEKAAAGMRRDVRTYLDALKGEVCVEIKLIGEDSRPFDQEFEPLLTEDSLDLTPAQKIVETHNGRIDIDQGDQADLRICVFLPAILEKQVKGTPNLLVVENSVLMRSILKEALEHEGFKVKVADNGASALKVLAGYRPDLIISDVAMPVMDGFDFFEAIRGQAQWEDIPFIFVTGQSEQKVELNTRSLRGATYLIKPIVIDELLVAVRSRLPE